MLDAGKTLFTTFIDYSAAFDTVSHKFIDTALEDAKASNKSRSLFRAVYKTATAVTKVPTTDGKEILSAPFPINRGVLQGDILSPLYFIIALELILRRYDEIAGKGVDFGGVRLSTLGYADDAALLDEDKQVATDRVTSISLGSKKDADMTINVGKTEVMHVKEQGRIPPATQSEAKKVCKHVCNNVGCGWR